MSALPQADGVVRVKALYDDLVADRDIVASASLPGDLVLVGEIAALLAFENRLLDARSFDRWLALWEADATYWVPLTIDAHPGQDQALFLDDRRRLGERVWRMADRSAWALWPAADTIRLLGSVEAWRVADLSGAPPATAGEEALAASTISIQCIRNRSSITFAGRQVHRLRRAGSSWRLRRKTLLLPNLQVGSPHLGWLL